MIFFLVTNSPNVCQTILGFILRVSISLPLVYSTAAAAHIRKYTYHVDRCRRNTDTHLSRLAAREPILESIHEAAHSTHSAIPLHFFHQKPYPPPAGHHPSSPIMNHGSGPDRRLSLMDTELSRSGYEWGVKHHIHMVLSHGHLRLVFNPAHFTT